MNFALFHDELVVGFQTPEDLLPLLMEFESEDEVVSKSKRVDKQTGGNSHPLIAQSI
jgi:hypothetical protein